MTVVVPVRNEGPRVLRLVEALLRQDWPKDRMEVLAVDGHSTDDTRERLEAHGIRVILDGELSAAEARNRGILEAAGDLVFFTDGDCVPAPDWVSRLAPRFDDPAVGGAGGAMRVGPRDRAPARLDDAESRAFYRGFITSNVAYRRDLLLAVGGFDPSLRCGEDWEVWWRVRDLGWDVVYEPAAVVEHEPEEVRDLARYLWKNVWYARGDLHMLAKRMREGSRRARRGERVAWREPLSFYLGAAEQAAWPLLLALAPFSPGARRGLVGLAGAFAWRCARLARGAGLRGGAVAEAVAYRALKTGARGWGTWVGVVDLIGAARRGPSAVAPRAPRAPEVAPRLGPRRPAALR